jgi:ABC-2 type transport system ATP-binding protein
VFGFLGPNGAGKTTAIRMLTTILEPTKGAFTVAGAPHTRPAEIRRRIGVLPESAGYPDAQTGEEYLVYHGRLHGHTRSSARAAARMLLDEVGLADRSRSTIGSYSRGMRQRLGIARALVNEPQVVFLDEPTLGLDPAGQRQVLARVRAIAAERGAAVLLSTHLLAEVEENCSRVLILNKGRVVAEGTVASVVERAAAPRNGCLHVAAADADHARAALRATDAVADVTAVDGQPGWFAFTLAQERTSLNAVLRPLLDGGVDVLALELERPRLSDAFLAVTEAA